MLNYVNLVDLLTRARSQLQYLGELVEADEESVTVRLQNEIDRALDARKTTEVARTAHCETCGDPVLTFAWTVWCYMWRCVGWHHAKHRRASTPRSDMPVSPTSTSVP